jgi:hypothetical protein
VESFLNFLFVNFDVAVWSSAMRHNVNNVINDALTPEQKNSLKFIFSQSECNVVSPHPDPEVVKKNPKKDLLEKPLAKVWAQYPQYTAENTLLIDDSKLKARKNPPNLLFSPLEWTPWQGDDEGLAPGGTIRTFLQQLQKSKQSVPDFVKNTIKE